MARSTRSSGSVDEAVIHAIARGTAAATGEAFFDVLVQQLAASLGVKCAWVTEWVPELRELRALSFWVDGRHVPDYRYRVAGTPCEGVIVDRCLVVVPDRVVEIFPRDPDLAPLGAVSYLGVPLLDGEEVLGHLAVLHDVPMARDATREAVLEIFGARAAVELARLGRDRALARREARWAGLVRGAMDGIVELDDLLRVRLMNPAAAACFGSDPGAMVGAPLAKLFSAASADRLARLAARLRQPGREDRAAWIPDGLEGQREGGGRFPAEATLSQFSAGGETGFTLIFRNIDERVAAEDRIRALAGEAAYLRAEIEALQGAGELIGRSQAMAALLADVERVAPTDASVLITGETGTGKELVARAIHARSARRERSLVRVNCAAIPAGLQESEFFGHEKGAFTGATQRRDGRFRLADGGTLFLDEIGDMPGELQAKLLRVLQEGEFEPLGSTRTVKVNVRVLAATHRDLEAMVRAGEFRQDLLYRLNVFPLRIPALRERGEDVVLLAEHLVARLARQDGRAAPALTPADRQRLRRYSWPGNVRELENVIERAWITRRGDDGLDLARALPEAAGEATGPGTAVAEEARGRILTAAELRARERDNMEHALEAAGWKLSGPGGAAELLGLHPNTLASRMRALGLRRP